jgi:uncharacterized delta-60 repeat protein
MRWSLSRSTRPSTRINLSRRFPRLERLEPRIAMDGTGIVITDINNGSSDFAWDIQIQADGKLVAVGTSTTTVKRSTNADAALVRYNADGTLDTSFSADGKVISSTMDNGKAVVLQNDGKIIAAGGSASRKTGPDIAVSRFNMDGSLDTSFDGDGTVATNIGYDLTNAVRLQTDQKIVVAGRLDQRFGVVRYNTNGSLDTSFGGTGKVTTDFGVGDVSFTAAEDLAVQSDGKIVAGGWGYGQSGSGVDAEIFNLGYFLIARYNADGSLDSTFGTGGKVTHFFGGNATAVYKIAIQPDGRILAIGRGASGVNVVVRYNSNGSLDTTFGNSGVVERFDLSLYGIALQSDGKIVLAGGDRVDNNGVLVTRLDINGNLDPTFGLTGTVQAFPTGQVRNVIVQPDGKIVIVGADGADFVIVRLNVDGSFDTTFGGGAAAASSSSLASADSTLQTTGKTKTADSGSRLAIDAVSVEQLLAQPESTWTHKSRVKLRV